jgi:hypothetical protein
MDRPNQGQEDDWFRKHEQMMLEAAKEKRREREKDRVAAESEAERKRLREAHFMKCPKCGHDLATENLSGVEIDRCTFCEGIWMDAGELEQLFAKKAADRQGIVRKLLGI